MRANNRNKLPIPGQVLTLMALGSTVLALAAVKFVPGVEGSARGFYRAAQLELSQPDDPLSRDNPHYTDGQFARMHQRPVTASRTLNGFYKLAQKANRHSDIFSNGIVADEARYLQHELQARTGRSQLWPGDKLDVPVVPDPAKKSGDA